MAEAQVEPWLRGTLTEVGALPRAVIHALVLAQEDVDKWCGGLAESELNARPLGLPPVAFQLRHISRSLDRLLTYAEGNQLSAQQISALKSEMEEGATGEGLFAEFGAAIQSSINRVRELGAVDPGQPRGVGKKQLPTSIGGLLVHVADHTQRHVGQAVTTSKVLAVLRSGEPRNAGLHGS